MNERTRKQLEKLDPESRAKAEAAIAASATPEARARFAEVRGRFRDRPGPDALFAMGEIDADTRDRMAGEIAAGPSDPLAALLREIRLERERQGLSFGEVGARCGMDRSAAQKVESGAVGNPTISTIQRYAEALGKRVRFTLEDAPAR